MQYVLLYLFLRQGNFNEANDKFEQVLKKIPSSKLVRSTLGVSFVLSDNKFALKNKVFKFLNEKDEETVLLKTAQQFYDGKISSDDYRYFRVRPGYQRVTVYWPSGYYEWFDF